MPFSDAYAPWLPTLQDIEVRKDDPELADYYQRFGFDNLEIPDDCAHVIARKDRLKELFNERYAFRMINQETLERWQIRLQTKLDRIVRVYERAYALYEKYDTEMMDDMLGGEKITRDTSADGSQVNTPDYATNASENYADNRSRSKVNETITTIRTGDGLVDSVNEGFRKWTDIDQSFISEFEDNFLNIFWY